MQVPIRLRLARLLFLLRSQAAIWALPLAEFLIIDGPCPDRTGRYRVIDTPLAWSEEVT